MRARPNFAVAVAVALALTPGCYCSHLRVEPLDAGAELHDAGEPRDGSLPSVPCTTVCDAPSVLARVPLDLRVGLAPAVLDAVVHRDELVVALLIAESRSFSDRSRAFSLARISRRTGETRIEVVPVSTRTDSIGAGALASRGETLTLIAAHGGEPITEVEPRVLLAIWEGAASSPTTFGQLLTDEPFPHCAGCFRRGASVAVGEAGGIVALAGEGVLHVGRVALETGDVVQETIVVPTAVPNTALEARGERDGSAVVAVGGLREIHGATPSPALAMVASESALEAAIVLPGVASDSVPHPWLHDGTLEVVRFVRDEGVSGGRLRRYAIEGGGTAEIGTVATAGNLPPLVIASTSSALLWVESSLVSVGEADLRVLAAPPETCETVTPATVVHLPTPLADRDPRATVATEADGRTYAILIEQAAGTFDSATLVVFDLGVCRDGT
jgi:hypothetical protein